MRLSVRKSSRTAKIDEQTRGQEAVKASSEASQAIIQSTRRITRSTCRPGDLLDPGGPGSFSRTRSDNQRTVIETSTASSGQEHWAISSAGGERSSTQSLFQASHIHDTIESSESLVLEEEDFLDAFYEKIGYLAPLDNATLDAIEHFLDISAEAASGRTRAENMNKFEKGLEWRNVPLKEGHDPYLEELQNLTSVLETSHQLTPEEQTAKGVLKTYHDQLWERDRKKCEDHSQEAIFQRTLLISMIDRLNLIYTSAKASEPCLFDFAVETPWSCPPMPTRAAIQKSYDAKWLPRPRPDLAVAFVRKSLFPKGCDWSELPPATQKLICYEGDSPENSTRAFHFLTIEAKRAYTGIDDRIARNQCLNNASQALHNMYEFFKEADAGVEPGEVEENYMEIFFTKVRVFSIVATDGGMKIRIHRACDKDHLHQEETLSTITEDYPLQFAYSDYAEITRKEFTYHRVVEELSKIVLGYGAKELKKNLQSAIRVVHKKFADYRKEKNEQLGRDEKYYSHGQVPSFPKKGKGKTASGSVAASQDYASESSRARTARPSKDSRRSISTNIGRLGLQSQGSQTDSFLLPPASASPSPSSEMSQQQSYGRGNKRRRV